MSPANAGLICVYTKLPLTTLTILPVAHKDLVWESARLTYLLNQRW